MQQFRAHGNHFGGAFRGDNARNSIHMINNYICEAFLYNTMNPVLRHDSACPLCQAPERVPIKRLSGTLGMYCPSCKFVEDVGSFVDSDALRDKPEL
jgi:hypothetical protein